MAKQKTLEERYADDILTDNAALNHYSQCKDCIFRDNVTVNGWEKCFCRMFGRATVSRLSQLKIPYLPAELPDKPNEVYTNTANCEFYEQEKRKK